MTDRKAVATSAANVPTVDTSQVDRQQTLLAAALESGQSPETIKAMVDQVERMMAMQASREMAVALHHVHSVIPPIPKNQSFPTRRKATADDVQKAKGARIKPGDWIDGEPVRYADFPQIARHIADPIRDCGLSYDFDVETVSYYGADAHFMKGSGQYAQKVGLEGRPAVLRVTCIVRHIGGGKHTSKFEPIIEYSASQNPTQSVAVARSYGMRYALIQALGLSTEETHDLEGEMESAGSVLREPPPEPVEERHPWRRDKYGSRDECVAHLLEYASDKNANADDVAQSIGLDSLNHITASKVDAFLHAVDICNDLNLT